MGAKFLDRRSFLQWATAGLAMTVPPGIAGASVCSGTVPQSIQLTFASLSASAQSFGAYRILPDDTVHAAAWDGSHRLLSLGAPTRVPGLGFGEVRDTVGDVFGWFAKSGGGSSQFSNWIEISDYGSRRTRGKVLHDPPAAIAALLERFESASLRRKPEGGRAYVWTNPVPSAGVRDLDLAAAGCDDPVARAISDALATGAVAVPLDAGAERYLSGENANRIVFIAEADKRLFQFGVVRG
jgi:hypothetical protein